ncbi:MAG: hypothetical protein JRI68_31965 [Deltaproteobacteria bacterium]|nr:hypothetical protein [Deltaproteobacteria bacterium]
MKRLASLVPAFVLTGLTALSALCASPARADVAPPPDYVEQCTLTHHQAPRSECVECGDAYHGEPDACRNRYAQAGYSLACRTGGASVWEEIWCRPMGTKPAPDPVPTSTFATPPDPFPANQPPGPGPNDPNDTVGPQPTKSGSCGACTVGSRTGTALAGLALLGLALAALGRRRSRSDVDDSE